MKLSVILAPSYTDELELAQKVRNHVLRHNAPLCFPLTFKELGLSNETLDALNSAWVDNAKEIETFNNYIETKSNNELIPVIMESPYAGDIINNVDYALKSAQQLINEGYAPIASHLLFTRDGILDDNIPVERTLGIEAGLAWKEHAEKTFMFVDNGISNGMKYGYQAAYKSGLDIELRSLYKNEEAISNAFKELEAFVDGGLKANTKI